MKNEFNFFKMNYNIKLILLIFISFFIQKTICINLLNDELIDLTTGCELPSKYDKKYFYIPIIHTNDIHGSFYPKKILLPSGEYYSIGGLEYLGKYISIMHQYWNNRILYFDCGDQFQGGIEGYISKGEIIMDFLNKLNLNKAVIGNHEYVYGIPFMKNYMNFSNFEWIIDNIKNLTSNKKLTFPHQKITSMIDIEGYRIGIIGLSTIETSFTTVTDISEIKYEEYIKIINNESEQLRKDGANAVIVIAHIGLYCRNEPLETKLEYKLRDKNYIQADCNPTDEAYILLHKLKPGTIDLFLGGHKHDVTHHWVNGIPVMSNERNGKYAQIVYLPFDRKTKKLDNNKIVIEGPLPICDKIFKNKKICDLSVINEEDEIIFGKLVNYKFHGIKIEKEESVLKIGMKYQNIFNQYDKDYLTKTNEHFESKKSNENNLGNFYADFLRQISGADISVINPGNFRTPFYRGNISNATIHSFDPFGNNIIKFYAFGWEIKKMFKVLQGGDKGFYASSGIKMTVANFPVRKLLSIKLYDGINEKEIEDNKYYSIVSIEFCFPINGNSVGGDDFRKVYEWFRPRNPEYVHVGNDKITRDILINFLRNIDELKGDKYYNRKKERMRIID